MLVLACGCSHLPEDFNWGAFQILGWATPWNGAGSAGPWAPGLGGRGRAAAALAQDRPLRHAGWTQAVRPTLREQPVLCRPRLASREDGIPPLGFGLCVSSVPVACQWWTLKLCPEGTEMGYSASQPPTLKPVPTTPALRPPGAEEKGKRAGVLGVPSCVAQCSGPCSRWPCRCQHAGSRSCCQDAGGGLGGGPGGR